MDSIRRYWVHGEKDRERSSRGCKGSGQWSSVIGEFGHGLSITNPPVEFRPINLCKRHPRALSFYPHRPPYARPFLSSKKLSISIGYSLDVRCPKARISPLMHAIDGQVPTSEINSHPCSPSFSRFHPLPLSMPVPRKITFQPGNGPAIWTAEMFFHGE